MTGAIAHLKAMLGMDSKEFKAGMKDATKSTTTFQNDLKKVGSMIAGAFSVAAVVGFGKALVNWASDVSEAAQNAGVLTSEMMALNEIAVQGGLGVDEMRRMLSKMQTELSDAANGSDIARKKFKDLGLDIVELSGMNPAQMFQAVAKAAMDSASPLAALSDIFGDRLGPKAFSAIKDLAENDLPAVGKAAAAAADHIEDLGDKWDAFMEKVKRKGVEFLGNAVEFVESEAVRARAERKAFKESTFMEKMGFEGTRKSMAAGETAVQEYFRQKEEERNKRQQDRQAQIDATTKATQDRARANEEKRSREIGAMADNAEALGDTYEENAAKDRKERDEKEQAKKDAMQKREQSAVKSYVGSGSRILEQIAALSDPMKQAGPAQIQSDGLARVGGFMGNERAGFDVASKQLAIQRETKDLLEELVALDKELIENITAIRTGAT